MVHFKQKMNEKIGKEGVRFPHHMVHFKPEVEEVLIGSEIGFHTTWYILNTILINIIQGKRRVSTPHGTF